MINNRNIKLFLVLFLLPLSAIIFSLTTGRFNIFREGFLNFFFFRDITATNLFLKIRLPRAISAFFVGGILSMSGFVLQNIFRNPLVSSDIIGISSGATFGTTFSLVVFNAPIFFIQISSFIGGLLAVAFVFYISKITKTRNITNIVISGMLVNSLAQAGITFLKYISDPIKKLPALEYWLMGSFNKVGKKEAIFIFPIAIISIIVLHKLRWQINIISTGDDDAKYLGLDVNKIRLIIIIIVTFSVSSAVSISGNIGWIGLVAPHIIRLFFGNQKDESLLLSFFLGGSLMLFADTLSRSILTSEMPISVVTALIGAPLLGYLLLKVGNEEWE